MPAGHLPFADLFPDADPYPRGVYPALGAYTGVLRRDPGAVFAVRPTRYATDPGGDRRDAAGYLSREPDRCLFALAGGATVGADGVVYDPASGRAVRETLEQWDAPHDAHPVFAGDLPPAERLAGVGLLLGGLGGRGFYHFLIEVLPKLALAGDVLSACDHLLVPGDGADWRVGWLRAFGADPGRVRWLGDDSHLVCDQLLFTGRLVRHFEPNPWAVGVLRAAVPLPAGPGRATLWLDRTAEPNRHVDWEPDLRRLVSRAEPVDLRRLSPAGVAGACATAGAVVGLHGAGFANMVFCPPGTRVVEFQPEPVAPWFARLAAACGHHHLAVPVTPDALPAAAAVAADFLGGRMPA